MLYVFDLPYMIYYIRHQTAYINKHILYLCLIFLVPLYGEGSYLGNASVLPNSYYVLYIIKICLKTNFGQNPEQARPS